MSIHAAAKDLGIPVNTLYTWVRKYRLGAWVFNRPDSAEAASSTPSRVKGKLPSSSQKQHDRLNDLERKNRDQEVKIRRLTMERDVLKKAMAYV